MRLPRVRLTVQRTMIVVAVIALGMAVDRAWIRYSYSLGRARHYAALQSESAAEARRLANLIAHREQRREDYRAVGNSDQAALMSAQLNEFKRELMSHRSRMAVESQWRLEYERLAVRPWLPLPADRLASAPQKPRSLSPLALAVALARSQPSDSIYQEVAIYRAALRVEDKTPGYLTQQHIAEATRFAPNDSYNWAVVFTDPKDGKRRRLSVSYNRQSVNDYFYCVPSFVAGSSRAASLYESDDDRTWPARSAPASECNGERVPTGR